MENSLGGFLRRLKIELSYNPAILLLGMYQKEMKSLSQRDICTPMFIASLFTVAKETTYMSIDG